MLALVLYVLEEAVGVFYGEFERESVYGGFEVVVGNVEFGVFADYVENAVLLVVFYKLLNLFRISQIIPSRKKRIRINIRHSDLPQILHKPRLSRKLTIITKVIKKLPRLQRTIVIFSIRIRPS